MAVEAGWGVQQSEFCDTIYQAGDSGPVAVGCTKGALRLFNEQAELLTTEPAHEGAVSAIVYSDESLYSTGLDGTVRAWEIITTDTGLKLEQRWKRAAHQGGGRCMAVGEGRVLFSGGDDGNVRSQA